MLFAGNIGLSAGFMDQLGIGEALCKNLLIATSPDISRCSHSWLPVRRHRGDGAHLYCRATEWS